MFGVNEIGLCEYCVVIGDVELVFVYMYVVLCVEGCCVGEFCFVDVGECDCVVVLC